MINAAPDIIPHLIQTALTPVFLLSGIGTLMQLFNSRLASVAENLAHACERLRVCPDQVERIAVHRHIARFRQRMWLLDAAIALAAFGAASSCGAAFVLFLGGVRNSVVDSWLIALFAFALASAVSSLVVFVGDSAVAWIGLRQDAPLPHANHGTP